ncbi:hypothetical protein [Enterococcus pallens]|uniref:Uncharacterized protein n=1 Tax=Enterococcus pallens ATCC BAA-351 TaxID=1158607 RepID=R2QRT7_9ENTE|nr:hypothetical protein [Enterococcus pallens]EOH97903.1 hypothetical protein UAU_00571 [Enterococcus pallens ATCC BAA-351]EOU20678.1 hypothetical protein I588_01525 [Enterococcus pallens ATCC BAA-351]OJG79365.1 hypothetical protein RV10_GL000867 [Enterococcus pallens]
MKLEDELFIKKAIISQLGEDEQLVALSMSKERKSAYACLVRGENNYLTFRISDHLASTSFYSNRTFNFNRENLVFLQTELADYLTKSSWYTFLYNDFFLLYTLKFAYKYHLAILIDDLYDIFSNEEMGIVFYQEKIYGKKKKDVNIVSPSMTKYLRKLFATGLLSSIHKPNLGRKIFVTELGMRLLDVFSKVYIDQYLVDFANINWNYLEIPNDDNKEKRIRD